MKISIPKPIASQLHYFRSLPACVAMGSAVLLIAPEDYPIISFLIGISCQEIDDANMAGRSATVFNPNAMNRKPAFTQSGMYPNDFVHAKDIVMFLHLAEVGILANVLEILLPYRQHLSSIGYQHAQTQRASALKAVKAACKRRGTECKTASLAVTPQIKQTSTGAFTKCDKWALGADNVATARKYGRKTVRMHPFKASNLKPLYYLFRGY